MIKNYTTKIKAKLKASRQKSKISWGIKYIYRTVPLIKLVRGRRADMEDNIRGQYRRAKDRQSLKRKLNARQI